MHGCDHVCIEGKAGRVNGEKVGILLWRRDREVG